MNVKWTEKDKEFIKQNAESMKDKELVIALQNMTQRKITVDAVRKLRQRLGIKKESGRGLCKLKKVPSDKKVDI